MKYKTVSSFTICKGRWIVITKVLDVAGLQNGIEKTLKSLKNKQTEMAEIQKAVQGILALEDAFKGQSGDAIRAYYQEVHLPFISYYQAFIADYERQLKTMDHDLQKLESAKNGRIDEAFLTEDLKTSLQSTASRTITLTDEANQTILSIQDIVATPSLNDVSFLEEVTDAQKQIQTTVEKVHRFDYNQSKALEELSNDVSNMQNYIDGIQAQMKSGKLQLENYTIGTLSRYQLDGWLKDEVGSTCSRVETEKVDRIEELQRKLAKASTPSEYLKIAKEIGIENLDDDQKQIVTMLETAEGIQKGLLQVGKDFLKGIDDFIDDPGKSIEGTIQAIAHPIETYDYLSKSITDSFQRDVINGDAKSRAEWISYALGTLGLSVVGTKGLGAVTKTGMTTVKATAKVGVHKVKGAAQKIPTLDLYPYAPQHQLAGVNAGIVPYNTVNSVGLRDQLISMAKVEASGSGKGNFNDPYIGVKQASEYLKSQGVPRQFRKTTLESFEIGTIRLDVAGSNTYGLRFYDNINAYPRGRYLFETFSPQVNRSNLALPPDWNRMTGIQQWQVKPDTIIIKGKAGPQFQMGNQYIGGVEQWYITNLDSLIKP
ncbi:T7SS effector LXG polymorphic toxin [Rummeliibacillus suwonensis]|uniref:T7SS effector LXG polymorphic toxin n=1 Tax=Rummeliibacillus suwonensis TaxID=1306154 RepID=UPI0011B75994|nr:T7SS effector LXG polymorphic toxin [Rummeliibacillus suwonensis]